MSQESFEHAVDLEELDGSKRLGRRTFLMGALATGAAASLPLNYAAMARAKRVPLAKDGLFKLGVASGFPRPKGITLWTELSGPKRTSKFKVAVATDPKFNNVVEEKLVTARRERGMTAKTFVKGLQPHKEYYYRFFTEDSKSEVGRFRTAPPADSQETIRIAYFSCQNYEAGFFNAQRAIANEPDIDLVVCLGDYIYEYSDAVGPEFGNRPQGHVGPQPRRRHPVPRRVPQKYRLYKATPTSAMHAAHPFISRLGRPRGRGQPCRRQPELGPVRPEQDEPEGPAARRFPSGAHGQRLRGVLRLHAARPVQGLTATGSTRTTASAERRPVAHRRAPVPRPAALRRRRSWSPAPTRRPRGRCWARRRRTGCSAPQGLTGGLEGLGHAADADGPAGGPERSPLRWTPGTATGASASRSSTT